MAHAQTARDGGLPKSVQLSGVVMNRYGKTVADVSIHHTGSPGQISKTNAEGRFEIQTRAPSIVFRKDGFTGKRYLVHRDADVEITLDPAMRSLKHCSYADKCLSLKGFMSEFCLPAVRGVTAGAQTNDIDYGQRQFLIKAPGALKGIQHAAGPMWSFGIPFDEDVWTAVEYHETAYRDVDGFLVIDARGRASNGECWRVLGHPFETASYRQVSTDEAKLLDKVLDGVCLRVQQRESR